MAGTVDINWNAIGVAVTVAVASVTSVYILGNSIVDGRVNVVTSAIDGAEKTLDARVTRNRALLKSMGQAINADIDRRSAAIQARVAAIEAKIIGRDRFTAAVSGLHGAIETRATDRELSEVQTRIARIEQLLFDEVMKGEPRLQREGRINSETKDKLVQR